MIEPEEMHALGVATPHTTHCLPSGDIMISTMGTVDGEANGDFVIIDGATWKVKGKASSCIHFLVQLVKIMLTLRKR